MQSVFEAKTKGGKWVVTGTESGGLVQIQEFKAGKLTASGGPYPRELAQRRLAAIIVDSAILDGIHYQTQNDTLGVMKEVQLACAKGELYPWSRIQQAPVPK